MVTTYHLSPPGPGKRPFGNFFFAPSLGTKSITMVTDKGEFLGSLEAEGPRIFTTGRWLSFNQFEQNMRVRPVGSLFQGSG